MPKEEEIGSLKQIQGVTYYPTTKEDDQGSFFWLKNPNLSFTIQNSKGDLLKVRSRPDLFVFNLEPVQK